MQGAKIKDSKRHQSPDITHKVYVVLAVVQAAVKVDLALPLETACSPWGLFNLSRNGWWRWAEHSHRVHIGLKMLLHRRRKVCGDLSGTVGRCILHQVTASSYRAHLAEHVSFNIGVPDCQQCPVILSAGRRTREAPDFASEADSARWEITKKQILAKF